MKAKVILEIDLPNIQASEEEIMEFLNYELCHNVACPLDNPFLDEDCEDYEVTDIEIELL